MFSFDKKGSLPRRGEGPLLSQASLTELSRRQFLKNAGSAAAAGTLALVSGFRMTGCSSASKTRPNVILILTDDQGYGDLGCHGNDKIRTPHLDRFHGQSVRFTNFYSSPLCSPTRASLLTGRYNYRTGVVDTWVGLALMRPEELTMAELLGKAGYRTGIFGKWHLGDDFPMRPMDQGFNECLIHKGGGIGGRTNPPGQAYYDPILFHNGEPKPYEGYCTDIFFSAAMDFIESNARAPFFVYIPTNVPHVPLEIKQEEFADYTAMGLDETTARHYGMLTNLDTNFGRLMAQLERLNLEDETLVIFMSDNGPVGNRYNASLRDKKGSVYDGGIKVPFFLRWPGKVLPDRDVDTIAAHIDVLPTILGLCGVPIPAELRLDGRNLTPLIQSGDSADWEHRTLFFQQCRPDPDGIDEPRLFTHCAARDQRYKIVMTAGTMRERNTKGIGVEETELYDMIDDPGETRDISRDHPEIVLAMREAYREWFLDVTRDLRPVSVSVGAPEQTHVTLTNQDLSGPGAATSYLSYSRLSLDSAEEPDGWGFWQIRVVRAGRYRVGLRFGPLGNGRELPLKAGEAVFALAGASHVQDIEAGSTGISFIISLPEGQGRLETSITGQRRDGKKVTPFFVDIDFLDD